YPNGPPARRLQGQVAGGGPGGAVVLVGGDGPLGDAHLVDLVGTVGEAGPAGLLEHVGEGRVVRVAERAVDLDGAVDDAPQAVGHEVLGHRHLRSEVQLV